MWPSLWFAANGAACLNADLWEATWKTVAGNCRNILDWPLSLYKSKCLATETPAHALLCRSAWRWLTFHEVHFKQITGKFVVTRWGLQLLNRRQQSTKQLSTTFFSAEKYNPEDLILLCHRTLQMMKVKQHRSGAENLRNVFFIFFFLDIVEHCWNFVTVASHSMRRFSSLKVSSCVLSLLAAGRWSVVCASAAAF